MLSLANSAARRTSTGQVVTYVLLALVAAFFIVPIIWLVVEAFGGNLGLISGTLGVWGVWLINSTIYSAAGAAIAIATCVPAGYAIATHEFPGRRVLLILTMLIMLIPTSALVLPLFLEANEVHLLTSPFAVILPYSLFPFGVYLSYLYFQTERFNILFQTARTDGCNEWKVFRRIAVPLSKPVAALIVFLNIVASWTNFFLPWVMYWSTDATNRYPLPLGIALQLFSGETSGEYLGVVQLHTTSPPSAIAFLLLATLAPVVVVLVLAQRWIRSGQFQGMLH